MAYVTIMDACFSGRHEECAGTENVPVEPDVVGGGHCVCECHNGGVKSTFTESIWEQTRRRRHGER